MTLSLKLDSWAKRALLLVVLLLMCATLAFIAVSHFIINTLSDDGVVALRSTLISAATYFPSSARLQARVARVELAETMDEEAGLARAESAALQSIRLAPWNSNHHLLLASVRNLQGDQDAAEAATRTAVRLAPRAAQAHWQLANLLVRQEKLDEALKEFQLALATDAGASLLAGTLDIVWNISDGSAAKLEQVVGTDPRKRLQVAQYLLKQQRLPEAVAIYKSIDRTTLLETPAATDFLNSLVSSGQLDLAKGLWEHLVGAESNGAPLYNGSFEKELVPALSQFDWKITHSEYATLSFDTNVAHSGKRSLRFNLTGRDTMVLDKEVSQTVIVQPGLRYRLEGFAKTEKLVTTEGIHVVVAAASSAASLGTSRPITTGSNDWQPFSVDFVAPAQSKAVLVTIKRTPRFSYDDPSKGTVWFDDFTLREVGK